MGEVEVKVRADVADLGVLTSRISDSLAEVAYSLARRLDDPDEKSPASVAKELRATLAEIMQGAADVDDDLDADLSSPVRDTA